MAPWIFTLSLLATVPFGTDQVNGDAIADLTRRDAWCHVSFVSARVKTEHVGRHTAERVPARRIRYRLRRKGATWCIGQARVVAWEGDLPRDAILVSQVCPCRRRLARTEQPSWTLQRRTRRQRDQRPRGRSVWPRRRSHRSRTQRGRGAYDTCEGERELAAHRARTLIEVDNHSVTLNAASP